MYIDKPEVEDQASGQVISQLSGPASREEPGAPESAPPTQTSKPDSGTGPKPAPEPGPGPDAKPDPRPTPPPVDQDKPAPQGPDGQDIANRYASQLDYLSRLARELGVHDMVQEYFTPVLGRWSDLEAEAGRWRQVGTGTSIITDALNSPLGKLDAAWDGAAATSFIEYMQRVGLAGHDLSDAMIALADVLDTTAEGLREIVSQMGLVLAETAQAASQAMTLPVQGDERTRQFLDIMRRGVKELFESVRQVIEAFVQTCEGIDGSDAFKQIRMAHTFPEENWSYASPTTPEVAGADSRTGAAKSDLAGVGAGGFGGGGLGSALSGANMGQGGYAVASEQALAPKPAPAGAATAAASESGGRPRMMGGMMPMAPMMGGMGQGSGGEHKPRTRILSDPQDIFGKPEKASTPVIGDDE